MDIDWKTITVDRAKRLLGAAANAVKRAEDQFRSELISEDDLLDACDLQEDLQVFIHTDERPAKTPRERRDDAKLQRLVW